MFSIQGIGTTLYGRHDLNLEDGSYIATKWIIVFLLPIIPLGSYRVMKASAPTGIPIVATSQSLSLIRVKLNWRQVIGTYLAVYGCLAVLFTLIYLV